jgi:zinc/manganese transport system substrate-binding protein
MDPLLDCATRDPVVLNAVAASGRTPPDGEELNEHVWYDLPAMQKLAEEIAASLSDLDPDRADDYAANAATFNDNLQGVIDRTDELRTELEGTPVAITEPVPGYLIEALGLKNLTPPAFSKAIEEGEDVSVGVLDQTLRLFTEHQVEALIYNDQTTGTITDQVESAAKDAGIAVVPVSETLPDGTDYVGWMSDNVEAIANALGAR